MRKHNFFITVCLLSASLMQGGCKKLLEIDPPISSVTTQEMFATNKQAEYAIAGIYSKMINGINVTSLFTVTNEQFASGLTTIAAGLSADELAMPVTVAGGDVALFQNKLMPANQGRCLNLWISAFRIVYDATAVIEGIEASKSAEFVEDARKQFTGEALFLRAFSYFYLVNFYGDLPLVLTSDAKQTAALKRSPVSKIYEQIIADLEKARTLLGNDFAIGKNEKVRVNKWVAEALLARVYLYTGQYQKAITSATEVINQKALFDLEPNLANVFLKGSKEAIFQLKQHTEDATLKAVTPEGFKFLQNITIPAAQPELSLTNELLGSFEANDLRKTTWTLPFGASQVPYKYKNVQGSEYYVVMRVAELYLIRAEATALGSPANVNAAIDDINLLRKRAGVDELEKDLPPATVIDAIAHERRVELFAEWGHRWLDLKRTGKAHDALASLPQKQPWWGDFQFLYPIPQKEIEANAQLEQNPEYNAL